VGFEREIWEREGLKGLFFVLASAEKQLDFTVPPAVTLWNKLGFFENFLFTVYRLTPIGGIYSYIEGETVMKRVVAAMLHWTREGVQRSVFNVNKPKKEGCLQRTDA